MTGLAKLLPRRVRARVEIIPLIDVIFFLLATFVLFTLALNKLLSLPVDLPFSDRESLEPPLIVRVAGDGGILWNQDLIDRGELASRLTHFRETTPGGAVLVSGDDTAQFGAAVEVLDQVRLAGIRKVTFDLRSSAHRR